MPASVSDRGRTGIFPAAPPPAARGRAHRRQSRASRAGDDGRGSEYRQHGGPPPKYRWKGRRHPLQGRWHR